MVLQQLQNCSVSGWWKEVWQVVAGKNPSHAWTTCRYRMVERSEKALWLGAGLSWRALGVSLVMFLMGIRILSGCFPYAAQIQYLEEKGKVPGLGIKSINYTKIAFFLQICFPFTDTAWLKVGNICIFHFLLLRSFKIKVFAQCSG